MILKSITLNGFKSFAKKTTIDVSKNVTGIVGPNGSGKSNIAEAVRFVMGEQSMKSIRSKSMGDLVFKGSSNIAGMSRASVSIEIDNKIKIYNEGVSPEIAKYLSYDEIILSREVFLDGGSVYKINGSEVRLKDVQSILALSGIGASAHTIISQGEADKILLANSSERKEMIEDSLGLKIHQIRLKDSDRKLKKVEENLKIVDIMRRELAPELSHLRIQMSKIEKIEIEREKLFTAYLDYFSFENKEIINLKNKISNNIDIENIIENKKIELNNLKLKEKELQNIGADDFNQKVNNIQKEISDKNEERFSIEREISILMYEKRNLLNQIKEELKEIKINKQEFVDFKNNFNFNLNKLDEAIQNNLSNNLSQNNLVISLNSLLDINTNLKNIFNKTNDWVIEDNNEEIKKEIDIIDSKIEEINKKVENIKIEILGLQNKVKIEENIRLDSFKVIYNDIYNLEKEVNTLESEKNQIINLTQNLENKESDFIFKLEEATKFVGQKVLDYKTHNGEENYNHFNNERMIERLKIRIEEIGILDPSSVKNNFEEISSRDNFLQKEIDDLRNTKVSLEEIISQLQDNIKNDFNKGLEKINFAFNNLFHEIFPGGRASIFVEKNLEKNNNDLEDIEEEVKEGINLIISLPSKKVTDINMLSGGEKTLASIALLFALTSITPPPFMVLDETDAALDEVNARKYGKLLSKLAEKSRLLVITHNRETMNECDILYGVTVGGDGSSKILSIKFD